MKVSVAVMVVGAGFVGASLLQASEFRASSVRALGMGGGAVASTKAMDASYFNPAAFGFFGIDLVAEGDVSADNHRLAEKKWGVDLDVGLGYSIFGSVPANLTLLEGLTVPVGNTAAGLNSAQLISFVDFSNGLALIDAKPGGLNLSGEGSLGARVLNYGLGVRSSLDLNVSVAFDNKNIGLGQDFLTALTGVIAQPVPGAAMYFGPAQLAVLVQGLVAAGLNAVDAVVVANNYNAMLTIENIQGASLSGRQTEMIRVLIDLYKAPGDLQNNQTAISTRGVSLTEVGFTYGYALDDRLSFGGVIKYMRADMVVESARAFGSGSADALGKMRDTPSVESDTSYGLDLGVLYRLPNWQFGLTVRNINAPSFEHSSGYVYKVKPQAKAGVAWIPMHSLTVEADIDLTENETAVPNSVSQYWHLGAEWDAFDVLALRLGMFNNMAEPDIGLVPTLGLGLNLWAVRVDAGLARSLAEVELNGKVVPMYMAGSLALSVDF